MQIEDTFTLKMDDWVREAHLFGDRNIAHTDRYAELGYPEPSAPSVSLLYRAERFMARKYKMPLAPFNMEMTLRFPAFAGEYICRQRYHENKGPIHIEFEHENDGIVASLLFEDYVFVNPMGDGLPKLVSYEFGAFVQKFFREEGRLGAVLGDTNIRFYEDSELGPTAVNLDIDEILIRQGRGKEYLVTGWGSQGQRKIFDINKARFVQKTVN